MEGLSSRLLYINFRQRIKFHNSYNKHTEEKKRKISSAQWRTKSKQRANRKEKNERKEKQDHKEVQRIDRGGGTDSSKVKDT